MDEPTNDLDTESIAALDAALLDFAGCALVTAHDRWFLDRIATHVLAWEGSTSDPGRWIWFEGNFADYEENKALRLGGKASDSPSGPHRRLSRQ